VHRSGKRYFLSASATRVYAMWMTGTYHDDYPTYVTHAVENDGRPVASLRPSSRPAALVAMRTSYSVKHGDYYQTKYEVRPFAMGDDGGLQHLDTVEQGCARHMVFHPSGKFLYVSPAAHEADDSPETLIVCWIDPQGRLVFVQEAEGAGGAMAVTLPAAAASASATR